MTGPYQGKRVADTHYVRNWRPSSLNSGFPITNEKYRDVFLWALNTHSLGLNPTSPK